MAGEHPPGLSGVRSRFALVVGLLHNFAGDGGDKCARDAGVDRYSSDWYNGGESRTAIRRCLPPVEAVRDESLCGVFIDE